MGHDGFSECLRMQQVRCWPFWAWGWCGGQRSRSPSWCCPMWVRHKLCLSAWYQGSCRFCAIARRRSTNLMRTRALAAMATFPCHVIPSNDAILYCVRWAATEMLSGVASVLSGTACSGICFSAVFLPHERLNWRKATGVMIGFTVVV